MKRTSTILVLLLSLCALYGQEIVGTWNGKIETPNGELRINFHISRADAGGYATTFDSPDQNAFGIPVDSTTFKAPELTFKVNAINFSYKGSLAGDNTIQGTMTQMGQSMELNLTRKDE